MATRTKSGKGRATVGPPDKILARTIYYINPRSKWADARAKQQPRITDQELVGEDEEMKYAMRQVTQLGRGGDCLTSRAKLLRIVRHALDAGFKMGRGR